MSSDFDVLFRDCLFELLSCRKRINNKEVSNFFQGHFKVQCFVNTDYCSLDK